jgi:hypothetical protein
MESVNNTLGFQRHDKSHTIVRMPVHLPFEQAVIWKDGRRAATGNEDAAIQAIRRAAGTETMLTAYFILNISEPTRANKKYIQTPIDYIYDQASHLWQRRQRASQYGVIGRLVSISYNQPNLFHLRVLLQHVDDATSFETLRTFNNVTYATYTEAASARGLINDHLHWIRTLEDICEKDFPAQIS